MEDRYIINVGTRKSQLALIQTDQVIKRLQEFYINNPDHPGNSHCLESTHSRIEFKVVAMSTVGDRILDKPLPAIGTKSLFTGELESALLSKKVDFVVHSLKDLPTTLPDGCAIGAVLTRDSPDDVLVLKKSLRSKISPRDLLNGKLSGTRSIKIGTSSQRRIAMMRNFNSNLECQDIRGNLNTRFSKLDNDEGDYAAIILAKAGLDRMGWTNRASMTLSPESDQSLTNWSYAVGQGAIAVECRQDDEKLLNLLSVICDPKTTYEVIAERCLMKKLEAGCSVPLGVRSSWCEEGTTLRLSAIVLSLDGTLCVREEGQINLSEDESKTDTNEESLNSVTTGLRKAVINDNISDSIMVKCASLGIEVANKMIGQGCLDLMTKR